MGGVLPGRSAIREVRYPGGPLPPADNSVTIGELNIVWCPLRAADLPDCGQ